jgi:hypothetical protein
MATIITNVILKSITDCRQKWTYFWGIFVRFVKNSLFTPPHSHLLTIPGFTLYLFVTYPPKNRFIRLLINDYFQSVKSYQHF